MFDENKQLSKNVAAVVRFASGLNRGETLLFTDIERLSGMERYGEGWLTLIRKVKRAILRERGIALWPSVNVGYKLLEHGEQLELCPRARQRQASRRLTTAIREIQSVTTGELTTHQQQYRASMIGQMISERRHVKRGLRYQRETLRKTEAMPMMVK